MNSTRTSPGVLDEAILAVLTAPMKRSEIYRRCRQSDWDSTTTVSDALVRLTTDGKIAKIAHATYGPTEA
jgi:hypothetical protein